MATISRDTPCLSITSVARNRLPVFRTDAIKKITCAALDEARRSGGFALFAYSLWDGHSNVFLVTSESVFMQRVNYIHQNPVRAGLVARAEDYRWSSARCWSRRILEDEPLLMDLKRIIWRKPR